MTNFSDIYQDFPIVGVVFSRATDCYTVGSMNVNKKSEGHYLCSVCFDLICIDMYLPNILKVKCVPA